MAWWTIDGVVFTGTVLTFGTGKDYPATISGWNAAAAAHGNEDVLCLCYAPSGDVHYPLAFSHNSNYSRYFKAIDSTIIRYGPYRASGSYTGKIVYEGVQFGISVGYGGVDADIRCGTCETIFSKCVAYGSYAFLGVNVAGAKVSAHNCTFYDSLIRFQLTGNSTNVRLHRVRAVNTAYGTASGGLENDYKLVDTVGYGALYGDDKIVYHAPVILTVSPANARVPLITGTQQYTATGVNDLGSSEDITTQVTWASSETGIATINSAGLATLIAEGDTVISATTADGATASVTLHVTDVTAGNKWSSDWRPPIAVCYLNGQVITVGASSSGGDTPSQSRIIRWSEIGQFDFLDQSATSIRNEAGFAYASDSDHEVLLNVKPLGNMAIVYGSLGCYIMKPVSKPVVSFGITRMADMPVGIPCTLAVAGNRQKHLLLGRDGNLRMLSAKAGMFGGETYEIKYLGFSEFFKAMVDKCEALSGNHLISVVYNEAEDEFYISDGMTSFKYDEAGLTEMGITVSSIINIKNAPLIDSALVSALGSAPIGFSASLQNKDDLLYMSDTFTFDVPGIKTIESLVVDGSFSFDALVEVMVMWRNSKKDTFAETDWLALSPEGFCAPLVSGMEFRLCIRAALSEDTEINKVHVTWKTSDRRFIRGNDVDRAET